MVTAAHFWIASLASLLAVACGGSSECGVEGAGLDAKSDGVPQPPTLASASEPPLGACGDGAVTAGEDCDDGNLTDYDGCTSECHWGPTPERCVGFVAAPIAVRVDQSISLVVRPIDPKIRHLDTRWQAVRGVIKDPTAAEASFVCPAAGAFDLTLSVPECPRTYPLRVTCLD